jgi:hypothetical protein
MASSVSVQAMNAEEAAAGRLSWLHALTWWNPASAAAMPTTLAITAKMTKNPVAAFPIGK